MTTFVAANRVKVTTTSSSTAPFTLGSAVSPAFNDFTSASIPSSSKVTYTAYTSSQFEVGRGTYNSTAGTLSRDGILESSNSDNIVSFVDQPTVIITKAAQSEDLLTFPVSLFGAKGDGSTDDTAAIQAAIDAAAAAGGGIVLFNIPDDSGTAWSKGYKITSTLNVQDFNVWLVGMGSLNSVPLVASDAPTTWLWWAGSAGGTMVHFQSPSGASNPRIGGGGMRGIYLHGKSNTANSAAVALKLTSYGNGTFKDLAISHCTSAGLQTTCLVSGTTLAAPADTSGNTFEHIAIDMWGTGATSARCFDLGGSTNANTSFDTFKHCYANHDDGPGFFLDNTDNVTFDQCVPFRQTGGLGWGWDIQGNTATSQNEANTFIACNWAATQGMRLRGTEAGFTSGSVGNYLVTRDFTNAAPKPTMGTGVRVIDYATNHTDQTWTATFGFTSGSGSVTQNEAAYANHFTELQFTVRCNLNSRTSATGYLTVTLPRTASYYAVCQAYHISAQAPLIAVIPQGDTLVYIGNISGSTMPSTGQIAVTGRVFTA